MTILDYALILFLVLEAANVALLYFAPGSQKGNAMGAFNAYHKSKDDPAVKDLISYLVNWVAGTKVIFILLIGVIILTGTLVTKLAAAGALVLSILTYYWRLHPLIRRLDQEGQISPPGYSRTLGIMIGGFVTIILGAGFVTFWLSR